MNELLLRFRLLAAAALAALLAACAPGTGGTGTGPDHGSLGPGSTVSQFEGNWALGATQASFDAKGIHARQGCVAVDFNGSWSAVDSEVRVPVEVQQSSNAGLVPAAPSTATTTLTANTTPEGTLRLVVSDSLGRTLIGPVELKRREEGGGSSSGSGAAAGAEMVPGC